LTRKTNRLESVLFQQIAMELGRGGAGKGNAEASKVHVEPFSEC